VAKAMAKLLEDRYQTIKELGDDLREVRRQMDASRPASALKAAMAPPTNRPTPSAASLVDRVIVDTATIPIDTGKSGTEEAQPLAIAQGLDSFDARRRLVAMTHQPAAFRAYISDTQELR